MSFDLYANHTPNACPTCGYNRRWCECDAEAAAKADFDAFLNRWRDRLPAEALERLIDARDRVEGTIHVGSSA